MSNSNFFPPRPEANPKIYVYSIDTPNRKGLLKIGYTVRDATVRIAEQLQTSGVKYKIEYVTDAMRKDGSSFTDHDIHRYLKRKGIANPDGEWFKCSLKDVKAATQSNFPRSGMALVKKQEQKRDKVQQFPI